jgi:hypothetical protein
MEKLNKFDAEESKIREAFDAKLEQELPKRYGSYYFNPEIFDSVAQKLGVDQKAVFEGYRRLLRKQRETINKNEERASLAIETYHDVRAALNAVLPKYLPKEVVKDAAHEVEELYLNCYLSNIPIARKESDNDMTTTV